MKTRLELLRALKADWEEREPCPLCSGTGDDDESETGCLNCDGVGVVPVCSWEEANKADAKELAKLELAQERSQ